MNKQFWSFLLSSHCEENAGLSLPYLVGANAMYAGTTPSRLDAERIIAEMFSAGDLQYHVSVCGMLKVPVFGILYGYGCGIRVMLDADWGSSDAEKLQVVVQRSEGPIRAKTFSRVRGAHGFEWGAFTSDEEKCIAESIKRYKTL